MIRLKKTFKFEAAHRLMLHEGRCRSSHGHSWKVVLEVTGPIGPDGMIIDFKVLGDVFLFAIDSEFDHATILNNLDPMVLACKVLRENRIVVIENEQPTCENLSKIFFSRIAKILPTYSKAQLVSVEVFESEGASAKYTE